MSVEVLGHYDVLFQVAEFLAQMSDSEPLPIEYGNADNADDKRKEQLLPTDHPFTQLVMSLVATPEVGEVLERLSNRFAGEGRFTKPDEVKLAILNTGEQIDSAFVSYDRTKLRRHIYLTGGSLFNIRKVLLESLGGKTLRKGHIIGSFLHEYFHPLKFEGHPEEYNADRAEIIAMIELGYDPQDSIEVMQAYDLMVTHKRGMGFTSSHPFIHSRIANMQATIDEVYASKPHLLEAVLGDEEVDEDILAVLFDNEELLREQAEKKQLFTLDSQQLRQRILHAKTFPEFWDAYLAFDLRLNTESALQLSEVPEKGYYHLGKIILVGRAVRFYYSYHQKRNEFLAKGEPVPDTLLSEIMDDRHGMQLNGNTWGNWDINQPDNLLNDSDGEIYQGVAAYIQTPVPAESSLSTQTSELNMVEFKLNYLTDILRALYGEYVKLDDYVEISHPDRAHILELLSEWLKQYYKAREPKKKHRVNFEKTNFDQPTTITDYNFVSWLFDDDRGPVDIAELNEFEALMYQVVMKTLTHLSADVNASLDQVQMYQVLASQVQTLQIESRSQQYDQDLLGDEIYNWSLPEIGGELAQQLQLSRIANNKSRGVGNSSTPVPFRGLTEEEYVRVHQTLGVTFGALKMEKFESLSEFAGEGAHLLKDNLDVKGLSEELLKSWLIGFATDDYDLVEKTAEAEVRANPDYGKKMIELFKNFKEKPVLPAQLVTGDQNFGPEVGGAWLYRQMQQSSSSSRYDSKNGYFVTASRKFKSACLDGYLRAVLPPGVLVVDEQGRIKETETNWAVRESAEAKALLTPIRSVFDDDWRWHYLFNSLDTAVNADSDKFFDLYSQLTAGDIDNPSEELVKELKVIVKALDITYTHRAQIRLTMKQFGHLVRAGVLSFGKEDYGDHSISGMFEQRAAHKQYDNTSKQMYRMAIDVLRSSHRKYQASVKLDEIEEKRDRFRSYMASSTYQKQFWWFASYFSTEFAVVHTTKYGGSYERNDTQRSLTPFFEFVLKNKLPIPVADWMGESLVSSAFITPADELLSFIEQANGQGLFVNETVQTSISVLEKNVSAEPLSTQDRLYLYAFAQKNGWTEDPDQREKLNERLRAVGYKWHRDDDARVVLLNLLTGGTTQGVAQQYNQLKIEVNYSDYSTPRKYLNAMEKSFRDRRRLEKEIPIDQQLEIAARFNGLKKFVDLRQMIDVVRHGFPVAGPLQDELLAYCWSLFAHFADKRHQQEMATASDYVMSLFSGEGWRTMAHDTTAVSSLSFYMEDKDRTPSYMEHTVGYKFFAQEIYETVGTRRFAYESALEYPFFAGSAAQKGKEPSEVHPAIPASFGEFFLARRLLAIDDVLKELLKTDFRAAIDQVRKVTGGISCAVVDIYVEYFIRTTLKRSDLTLDDANYLYEQFLLLSQDASKRSYLNAPLLRKRIDADDQFFADAELALAVVLKYLPEGGYERNEFIQEVETRASVTLDQVQQLESYIVDETGIQKDKERERHKVTLIDLVGDLATDQKGDLLFYLIDEKSPKPSGKIFIEFEKKSNADLSNLRTSFMTSSISERQQLIQRLVYGPEATLSLPHAADGDVSHASVTQEARLDREVFSERMAEIFVPEDASYPGDRIKNYRELLGAAFVSMDPLKASRVISNIVNKMIELDQQGEKLAVEDMLYIAVLSFGSVGIKSSQLVADYPWVPAELREVFKQGLWNAEIIRPAELVKVFQYEQNHLGNFQGYELKRFIRPLGSAGICQAYLVEVERDGADGQRETKQVVLKAVKPGVIGMKQIARDVRDLQRFLNELNNRGYDLDIPADLTDVITTIILEERNKTREAKYFESYKETNDQRSIKFHTPEVFAAGQFMIMVEYVDGKVLADTQHEDSEIGQLLFAAFQDLQIGVLNLDDHLGNFIRVQGGGEEQLASVDGGFTIDLRSNPDLHRVVKQLVSGLLSGDEKKLRGAMYALGLDGDIPDLQGTDMPTKIEQFRAVFFRAEKNEHTLLMHKLLWWMYRKLSLYHSASPFLQAVMAENSSI